MTNPPTDERRDSDRLTHKDGEVLDWIRERLVNVHGDDTNADFIHALERVRLRVHAQAALSHHGEVVEVAKLEALPRCDMFSEGFHNGSSCIDYDWNPTGDWIRWSDLTALISKAEKV